MMAAPGLVSSCRFWAGIRSAVLSSRAWKGGPAVLHAPRAGTMFWHLSLSLSHVGFDSVDVRMVWRFLWVVLPAAAAP